MIDINPHFLALEKNYLFSTITQKVLQYQEKHPQADIIKMGIGDTTLPLAPAIVNAWKNAVVEMGNSNEYRGYGPEQGYPFLRATISKHEYQDRGIDIQEDEIFISDGAKCDSANIQELFSSSVQIAISNPVYPVYYDSNVIAGRMGNIHFLNAQKENGFVVQVDNSKQHDLIYLCYPNNPTGVSATISDLQQWVDYAHAHRALIVFDAAYERFITDPAIPHSIYEIDGAQEVAIEMRSYSKTAGFTGARCAFTVVPNQCRAYHDNTMHALHPLWLRRCATKFNGVSYPVQKAAEAVYSSAGSTQVGEAVQYYLKNAEIICRAIKMAGVEYYGGKDSPYIWMPTGPSHSSWELFDILLDSAHIVTTPGVGFGKNGEGYIRISAFNSRENVLHVCQRLTTTLKEL